MKFDGSQSTDPDNDMPLGFAWTFGDNATGNGATPSHTYGSSGTYTVSLIVTDSLGAASTPVTTTATVANVPPTVKAGRDTTVSKGVTFAPTITFTDPGTADGPWTYRVGWGDGTAADSGSVTAQSTKPSVRHTYADTGTFTVAVSISDKDGGKGTDTFVATVVPAPPSFTLVGAGDIALCSNDHAEKTAEILDTIPGAVFTLGDNAYPDGSAEQFANCYEPTWGRHKARTHPTVGNIDYNTPGAAPYYAYFGAAAGTAGQGYYSYDLGTWHIIVLNDNIAFDAGSAQETWLKADLAAHPSPCTIAMWHKPRYYSPSGDRGGMKGIWTLLYQAHAEIVMHGHVHQYERYARMDPDGNLDPTNGIREFIVGTGGEGFGPSGPPRTNNEVLDYKNFGVLKLTLEPNAYSWEFVPVGAPAGPGTLHDSGHESCH